MNERTRAAMQRFNWIGGGVMLAVYVLLNFFAPTLSVAAKLLIALAAAVIVFALVETIRKKREKPEDEDEK